MSNLLTSNEISLDAYKLRIKHYSEDPEYLIDKLVIFTAYHKTPYRVRVKNTDELNLSYSDFCSYLINQISENYAISLATCKAHALALDADERLEAEPVWVTIKVTVYKIEDAQNYSERIELKQELPITLNCFI